MSAVRYVRSEDAEKTCEGAGQIMVGKSSPQTDKTLLCSTSGLAEPRITLKGQSYSNGELGRDMLLHRVS
jgi:hypothetical protein